MQGNSVRQIVQMYSDLKDGTANIVERNLMVKCAGNVLKRKVKKESRQKEGK